MVQDGRALAEARRLFDGKRECAPLLNGLWPVEQSAALLDSGGVRALVAAGLFTLVPVDADGRTQRFEPTTEGRRDLRLSSPGARGQSQVALCFAHKQVVGVSLPADRAASPESIEVTYRLTDVAPWARRPDIAAAFPFIAALNGRTLQPNLNVVMVRDPWRLRPAEMRAMSDPETTQPRDMPDIRFTACMVNPKTQADVPCSQNGAG